MWRSTVLVAALLLASSAAVGDGGPVYSGSTGPTDGAACNVEGAGFIVAGSNRVCTCSGGVWDCAAPGSGGGGPADTLTGDDAVNIDPDSDGDGSGKTNTTPVPEDEGRSLLAHGYDSIGLCPGDPDCPGYYAYPWQQFGWWNPDYPSFGKPVIAFVMDSPDYSANPDESEHEGSWPTGDSSAVIRVIAQKQRDGLYPGISLEGDPQEFEVSSPPGESDMTVGLYGVGNYGMQPKFVVRMRGDYDGDGSYDRNDFGYENETFPMAPWAGGEAGVASGDDMSADPFVTHRLASQYNSGAATSDLDGDGTIEGDEVDYDGDGVVYGDDAVEDGRLRPGFGDHGAQATWVWKDISPLDSEGYDIFEPQQMSKLTIYPDPWACPMDTDGDGSTEEEHVIAFKGIDYKSDYGNGTGLGSFSSQTFCMYDLTTRNDDEAITGEWVFNGEARFNAPPIIGDPLPSDDAPWTNQFGGSTYRAQINAITDVTRHFWMRGTAPTGGSGFMPAWVAFGGVNAVWEDIDGDGLREKPGTGITGSLPFSDPMDYSSVGQMDICAETTSDPYDYSGAGVPEWFGRRCLKIVGKDADDPSTGKASSETAPGRIENHVGPWYSTFFASDGALKQSVDTDADGTSDQDSATWWEMLGGSPAFIVDTDGDENCDLALSASGVDTDCDGVADSGGGGGTPGGSDEQVQFNDSSTFGGDAGLLYNKTTDVLTVEGGADLNSDGTVDIDSDANDTVITTGRTFEVDLDDADGPKDSITHSSRLNDGSTIFYYYDEATGSATRNFNIDGAASTIAFSDGAALDVNDAAEVDELNTWTQDQTFSNINIDTITLNPQDTILIGDIGPDQGDRKPRAGFQARVCRNGAYPSACPNDTDNVVGMYSDTLDPADYAFTVGFGGDLLNYSYGGTTFPQGRGSFYFAGWYDEDDDGTVDADEYGALWQDLGRYVSEKYGVEGGFAQWVDRDDSNTFDAGELPTLYFDTCNSGAVTEMCLALDLTGNEIPDVQIIDGGIDADMDGTADSGSGGAGSGTAGTIAKWAAGGTTLEDSAVVDNGDGSVTVGSAQDGSVKASDHLDLVMNDDDDGTGYVRFYNDAGCAAQVLQDGSYDKGCDGSGDLGSGGGSGFDPLTTATVYDEFLYPRIDESLDTDTVILSQLRWTKYDTFGTITTDHLHYDSRPGVVRLGVEAADTAMQGYRLGGFNSGTGLNLLPGTTTYTWVVQTSGAGATYRVGINHNENNADFPPAQGYGFNGNGGANWFCWGDDGTTETNQDSATAVSSTDYQTLQIEVTSSGGTTSEVVWKIDGTQVCSQTTDLLAGSWHTQPFFEIDNTDTGTDYLYLDYFGYSLPITR